VVGTVEPFLDRIEFVGQPQKSLWGNYMIKLHALTGVLLLSLVACGGLHVAPQSAAAIGNAAAATPALAGARRLIDTIYAPYVRDEINSDPSRTFSPELTAAIRRAGENAMNAAPFDHTDHNGPRLAEAGDVHARDCASPGWLDGSDRVAELAEILTVTERVGVHRILPRPTNRGGEFGREGP